MRLLSALWSFVQTAWHSVRVELIPMQGVGRRYGEHAARL